MDWMEMGMIVSGESGDDVFKDPFVDIIKTCC
jgi:hypothetical protein